MVCSSLDCSPEKLQRTVASVEDGVEVLVHGKIRGVVRKMRKHKRKRMGQKGELGVVGHHRGVHFLPAAVAEV